MPEKILLCDEISKLFMICYETKKCHEEYDKQIIYKEDIVITCRNIHKLYNICMSNQSLN
jgi:hypothetical protein